jgi:hypothetical protein
VELLLILILLDTLKNRAIIDAHSLHKCRQILHVEVSVRASMSLTGTRRMFRENLLATKRTVTTSSSVGVTSNITVYVTNIVTILFVKLVICHLVEALSPEHKTLLQIQADTLEEE